MPLPQPISQGRSSQLMPVLSTNRMPVKAWRSPTRLRPGRSGRLGVGGGGSRGSIRSQRASGSRGLAIVNARGFGPVSTRSHRKSRALSTNFVSTSEGNGIAERFIRTLKENLLWIRPFATVAELVDALREFKRRYNEQWLIECHGFRTP